MGFSLGSTTHVVILLAVAALGAGAGMAARTSAHRRERIVRIMGGVLAVSESVWYVRLLSMDLELWPNILPLHLCDIVVWLTVAGAVGGFRRVRETAYFWGLSGTTLALLTPDVQGLSFSYPVVQFFVSHGLVVATLVAMAISGGVRPDRSALVRAIVWLHIVAALLGLFNTVFGTNYLYLCSKPSGATMLDLFGAWPLYLLVADVVGILLFVLLWLPFRSRASRTMNDPA